jgi:uridine kinase
VCGILGWVSRHELLSQVAGVVLGLGAGRPVRVGIDGSDAAGKTTLADELAERLRGERPVIRAGIDGFRRPRDARPRPGDTFPGGYFDDWFDNEAVVDGLLSPLGPGGDRRYTTMTYDDRADLRVVAPVQVAAPDAVLLFDGVFVLQRALVPYWEVGIYLHADEDEVLRRGVARDSGWFGSEEAALQALTTNFLPGYRRYREQHDPAAVAHIVVDNTDPQHPVVRKFTPPSASE